MRIDTPEVFTHPVGAQVVVRHANTTVGVGEIDAEEHFEIELSNELRGELEITIGVGGAAPTMIDFDGTDISVSMIYSPGGTYY